MKTTFVNHSFAMFILLLSIVAAPALAETFTVKMMSYDPALTDKADYFDPLVLKIQPGDTVIFEPTHLGHNSASKKDMLPAGAGPWNGGIDEALEVTFSVDGTYGYICSPHYSVGMVGLILVGDYKVNLDQVRAVKQRGDAKKVFKALFEEVDGLQ